MFQMDQRAIAKVEKTGIVWDKSNPLSVYNVIPDPLKIQLDKVSNSDIAYLLSFDEPELRKELKQRGQAPSSIDEVLRIKFWTEYDRVHMTRGDRMWVTNIVSRVYDKATFYTEMLVNPYRLVWLLCPPESFVKCAEVALRNGVMAVDAIFKIAPENWDHRVRLCAQGRMRLTRDLSDMLSGQVRRPGPRVAPSQEPGEPEPFRAMTVPGSIDECPLEPTEEQVLAEYLALQKKMTKAPGEPIDG